MKVVNKELGLLVDMSERNKRKFAWNEIHANTPESVEEIELDEDAPKATKNKGNDRGRG